jgi:hypothetical protein
MRQPPDRPSQLSIGAHLSPDDGACLMELVSAVAGEPWTDAPRCTHALVAHVARLVNDASSDVGRAQLLRYLPMLAQARNDEYSVYPRIALACTSMGLRNHPSALLAYLHDAARRQLAAEADVSRRRRFVRLRRSLYRRGPAHRAIEAAVAGAAVLPTAERDQWLQGLLEAAISIASGDAQRQAESHAPARHVVRNACGSGSTTDLRL